MTSNHEAAEQAKHSSAVNEELKARQWPKLVAVWPLIP